LVLKNKVNHKKACVDLCAYDCLQFLNGVKQIRQQVALVYNPVPGIGRVIRWRMKATSIIFTLKPMYTEGTSCFTLIIPVLEDGAGGS
jgi:hypothetical protein